MVAHDHLMTEMRPRCDHGHAWPQKGETVGLACFCGDETLCHRSIVAGLLQGAGADVRLASGADYSRYFEAFRAMEKRP